MESQYLIKPAKWNKKKVECLFCGDTILQMKNARKKIRTGNVDAGCWEMWLAGKPLIKNL